MLGESEPYDPTIGGCCPGTFDVWRENFDGICRRFWGELLCIAASSSLLNGACRRDNEEFSASDNGALAAPALAGCEANDDDMEPTARFTGDDAEAISVSFNDASYDVVEHIEGELDIVGTGSSIRRWSECDDWSSWRLSESERGWLWDCADDGSK